MTDNLVKYVVSIADDSGEWNHAVSYTYPPRENELLQVKSSFPDSICDLWKITSVVYFGTPWQDIETSALYWVKTL